MANSDWFGWMNPQQQAPASGQALTSQGLPPTQFGPGPMPQPQVPGSTTQQITGGPLAPAMQAGQAQGMMSPILARLLATSAQSRPQGNMQGLGGNLMAQALLSYLYKRQQQQQQPAVGQMGMAGQGPQTQPFQLPQMPQGGLGAGAAGGALLPPGNGVVNGLP